MEEAGMAAMDSLAPAHFLLFWLGYLDFIVIFL